ncbi:MAG: putative holin-like toxin [Lachnospiraceae bacterium]|nr:putative holin-like toxin [Lachnospiraceae bacterium]
MKKQTLVTYDTLIQLGLFIIALIGLVYKISHKDKK